MMLERSGYCSFHYIRQQCVTHDSGRRLSTANFATLKVEAMELNRQSANTPERQEDIPG